MISPEHARTMARYNAWMNDRLYETCARFTDAERKRDAGAFFRSIHGTFNHLLLADRIWMGRFTGRAFAARSLDQELYADYAELRAQRRMTDGAITAWTAGLTTEALAAELSYTSLVNPEPRRYPLWFAVTHFFNHQAHHRGQLTTLIHQLGVDPGVTDLIALPPA